MRLYNTTSMAVDLHLVEGYTQVPPRRWFPAEGAPELAEENADLDQVRGLRMSGVLEIRRGAPPAESPTEAASPVVEASPTTPPPRRGRDRE